MLFTDGHEHGRGFGVQPPNQLSENPTIITLQNHPHGRSEERGQYVFQFCTVFAGRHFIGVEKGQPLLVERSDTTDQDGFEQSLFGFEVIVDGGQIDFCRPDDAAKRTTGESLLGKHVFRDIQDSLSSFDPRSNHTNDSNIRLNHPSI